jgi:endonuclease/exonuclease/phosphatase family metal-dependent hydrolase
LADRRLSVLHWNIHSWRDDREAPNEQAVEGLISELRPDAVSLTEVSTAWGEAGPLSEIAGRLKYRWVFVPTLEYRGEPATEGYGNALLTRLPILAVQQWRVHSPDRYANNEPSEPRTVALARLEVAGTPVWVGATHLPANQEADRSRALTRLAALLRQLDPPWLVCGDFNTAVKTWRDELPEGVSVVPRWRKATFPTRPRPVRAIDYALVSPGLTARGHVVRRKGSDHWAVYVTARLDGRAGGEGTSGSSPTAPAGVR